MVESGPIVLTFCPGAANSLNRHVLAIAYTPSRLYAGVCELEDSMRNLTRLLCAAHDIRIGGLRCSLLRFYATFFRGLYSVV